MASIGNFTASDFAAASKKAGYSDLNKFAQTLGYVDPNASQYAGRTDVTSIGAYNAAAGDNYSKLGAWNQNQTSIGQPPLPANYTPPATQPPAQSGINYQTQTPGSQYETARPDDYVRGYDPEIDINAIAEARAAALEAKLRAEAQRQIAEINNMISQVQPRFDQSRQMTTADAAIAQRNFDRYLADRGISNTGATGSQIQTRLMQEQGLAGRVGDLNTQQQDILKEYDFQKIQAEQAMAAALASGLEEINIQGMQDLVAAKQAEEDQRYEKWRNQMDDWERNINLDRQAQEQARALAETNARIDDLLYGRRRDAEQTSYDRTQDTFRNDMQAAGFNEQVRQFQENMNFTKEQAALDEKQRQYENRFNANKEMGYVFPVELMQQSYNVDEVAPYYSDVQAEIDRRAELIRRGEMTYAESQLPELQAYRLDKMIANPDMLRQYGDEFRTVYGRTQEAALVGQQISNEIAKLELANLPEKQKLELEGIRQQLEMGEIDIAIKDIQRSFLPEQLKTDIMATITQMEVSRGQLGVAQGNLALARQRESRQAAQDKTNSALDAKRLQLEEMKIDQQLRSMNYADTSTEALLDGVIRASNPQVDKNGNFIMDDAAWIKAQMAIDALEKNPTVDPRMLNGVKAELGFVSTPQSPEEYDPR